MFDNRAALNRVTQALLVGVQCGEQSRQETENLLQELADLSDTLGVKVGDKILVKIAGPQARFFIGSGKADEITELAKEKELDLIIFDNELSPAQQRNWEKLSGLPVIDREEVILEIFARRARTKEARLQVGLALMEYSLPRLTRAWAHLSRQGGGVGGRGEGETQLETDRRIVARRIDRYRAEIEEIRSQRATQRKQRERRPTPVVAIVGYTNAGKSSLMRALTGAEVFVENRLFATLDTTTRQLKLPNGVTVLLSDTVGFVRRLPHRLVESFKTTLEEAVMADVLVHVLDCTSPEVFEFHKTTMAVLHELGADTKKMLTVFNKIDLAPDATQIAAIRQQYPEALFISTHSREGLDELCHRIADSLHGDVEQLRLCIPASRSDLRSRLHSIAVILSMSYDENGCHVIAQLPRRFLSLYKEFIEPEPEKKKTPAKKRKVTAEKSAPAEAPTRKKTPLQENSVAVIDFRKRA